MRSVSSKEVVRLLAVAAVLAFCVRSFSDNKADVDLWGNVGFVKALPWSADFHRTNTFSFTEPDHPWINHEWLAQYIFHVTYERLGNTGLLTIKIILGLCVVFLMNLSMEAECRNGPIRLLYLLLIVSTMGYGFSTRPHHFTYVMYALFLLLLKRHPENKFALLLLMPALGILWANLHGAFFIGAVLMALYAVMSRRRVFTLLTATGLFVAATLINPYGFKLWAFVFQSATKVRLYLSEWAMFNPLRTFYSHVDFMVLALITLLAVCFSRVRKDITWIGILAVSFIGAVLMRRNIPLFAITAGFAAPRYIENAAGAHVARATDRVPRHLLAVLLSVFIVVSTYYTLTFHKINPLEIEIPRDRFPLETVTFMSTNKISGNALVFFDWAEYCIWKLYPECRVFLDGRFRSAYSPRAIDDYFNFLYLGENWHNALTQYPTDIVLIHRGNPVYGQMLSRQGWLLAHEDGIAGLFLKKSDHAEFLNTLATRRARYPETGEVTYFP